MSSHIFLVPRYTRGMISRNPQVLFVFGDNLARVGFGGQAAAARGEPNSVGIVTKMSPSKFLTDNDVEAVKGPITQAFVRLKNHLQDGGDIVWPADGVGTGLARLEDNAPQIAQAIEACRELLFTYARSIITE